MGAVSLARLARDRQMKKIKVKRTIVAELFDHVRRDLANRIPPEEIEARLARGYDIHGAPELAPLTVCHHEPHTDNCWACAPRWGHIGPKVVCS